MSWAGNIKNLFMKSEPKPETPQRPLFDTRLTLKETKDSKEVERINFIVDGSAQKIYQCLVNMRNAASGTKLEPDSIIVRALPNSGSDLQIYMNFSSIKKKPSTVSLQFPGLKVEPLLKEDFGTWRVFAENAMKDPDYAYVYFDKDQTPMQALVQKLEILLQGLGQPKKEEESAVGNLNTSLHKTLPPQHQKTHSLDSFTALVIPPDNRSVGYLGDPKSLTVVNATQSFGQILPSATKEVNFSGASTITRGSTTNASNFSEIKKVLEDEVREERTAHDIDDYEPRSDDEEEADEDDKKFIASEEPTKKQRLNNMTEVNLKKKLNQYANETKREMARIDENQKISNENQKTMNQNMKALHEEIKFDMQALRQEMKFDNQVIKETVSKLLEFVKPLFDQKQSNQTQSMNSL